ncbi:fumarylacetoacetate hydrolase [Streptomyces sp. DvalAA-14]|uniref:fumarylacetoacetase n=1 Tax=unclassified Streptomyces TaxID=2593676 RepID=UPI00081B2114|nr:MULTISPECIES: fumarylacetoacetase [unclassified Streptomyces]MYS22902.1 fumarylacetoacetase [Streptomyces sp. SID4948]SCE24248.1 fumarylacetoacetate hydrolase [Streptomyces sp. DvalAA-14]
MPSPSPLDVPPDALFGAHNLPYGVFSTAAEPGRRRLGVAYGDQVLDAGAAARATGAPAELTALLTAASLNPLLAAGRPVWTRVRAALTGWLTADRHRAAVEPCLIPRADVVLHLPFDVADYVDFYASEHHAATVGRIFRPGAEPLTPNWKHLPIGYHGRAGTVVVSGTPVVRPCGQRKAPADPAPDYGPSRRLDIEAELGFVVGAPTAQGSRVALADADAHVFGVCLVNDWSARDLQSWEYVPLGPFLGKSFATSVSPWVVPLDALAAARVDPPPRDTEPLPYLDDRAARPPYGLDIALEVRLNGHLVARPRFAAMYWTYAQMLAHLTVNGASLRAGDLFASGTVSGPERWGRGALIELTWNGEQPLELPDGSRRGFLEDGDEVTITATAPGPGGARIGLGAVSGRIAPAH